MNYFNQAKCNLKTACQFYSAASEKGYKESNGRISTYLRNKIGVNQIIKNPHYFLKKLKQKPN
jgi:hypothetical protein